MPRRHPNHRCRYTFRETEGARIGTGCFLARHFSLRGYNHDWLARCQNNVAGWYIHVLCRHSALVLAGFKTRAQSRLIQQAALVVI